MPGPELIPLAFDSTQALQVLDEIEQRLARIGQNAINVNGGGGSGGGGGNGSAGAGGSEGSGSDRIISGVTGAIQAALAALNRKVEQAQTGRSPYEIGGDNSGGLFGGSYRNRALIGGMEAGADLMDKVPGAQFAAGYLRLQAKATERDVFEPTENAAGRLAGVAGQLGRAGVSFGDDDLKLASDAVLQQEQRAYEAKKRVYQLYYSSGYMQNAWTHAMNPGG